MHNFLFKFSLKNRIRNTFLLFGTLSILASASQSLAYLTVVESGELLPIGEYRLTAESQFGSLGSGLTVNLHFDSAIDESSQIRFSTGFGGVDFFGAFSYKWIPIPDVDKQPAIGFKADATYGKDGNHNAVIARFIPLASKKFRLDMGEAVPYVALPIGISASNSSTTYPSNLVIGSELAPQSLQKINFGSELGINLNDSSSYFSFYAVFYFDRKEGIRLK